MDLVRGVPSILVVEDALCVVRFFFGKNRRSIIFLNSFGSIDQIVLLTFIHYYSRLGCLIQFNSI